MNANKMSSISELFICPECVEIGNSLYALNTDFAVWIEIEQLLFSDNRDQFERFARILGLAFCNLPPDPVQAIERVLWFHRGGRDETVKEQECHTGVPAYNLKTDFEYIYAAFLGEYGIDLTETKMHWWKFLRLLSCLSDKNKFSQIVSFRCMETSKIKNKDVRAFYEKMKKRYRLPDLRTTEEKEEDLARKLEGLF